MCDMTGCTSPSEFRPVLVLRSRGFGGVARMVFRIGLCLVCKSKAKAADFLTDEGWAKIVEAMASAKKAEPTRELTTIDFCGLKSKEARSLEEHRPS